MDHHRLRVRSACRAAAGLPSGGRHPAHAGLRLRPSATRIALLCHGATRATRATAFAAADEPLAPRALTHLRSVAERLGRVDRCFCGPETSVIATASALGLAAVGEPLLRGCDYGRWTGRTFDDVLAAEPDAIASWLADPDACPHGGETLTDVAARVHAWLATCADPPGRVLAVAGPLPIRVAAVLALGAALPTLWRLDVAPLSVTRLTAQAGRWRLAGLNEVL